MSWRLFAALLSAAAGPDRFRSNGQGHSQLGNAAIAIEQPKEMPGVLDLLRSWLG
jgi:hypothetical protein